MQPIKVLIVDDEPDFTDIVSDRLRSWGFAVTTASNGPEALASILQKRPDVVVLSLQAGNNHGLETLRMIKDHDQRIEVLLLSGKGTVLAGMHGMGLGAFDCLPQPIELSLLIEMIRAAHAQGGGSPPLPGMALVAPMGLPLAGDGPFDWIWTGMLALLERFLLWCP
jgi:DNA-binding response OmpR family regulator